MNVKGNIIDILNKRIFKGEVVIENGYISAIREVNHEVENYILPGFVDAHIHIESSMVVPSEFAKIAVLHGTVATVSDPHEIANVLGVQGVDFMIENEIIGVALDPGRAAGVKAKNGDTVLKTRKK